MLAGTDGDVAEARSPMSAFLLLLEVSHPNSKYGVKSDYWCLAVPPSPVVLCSCFTGCADACCSLVMLLSGDVELNLGPRVEDQLTRIINGRKAQSCHINSVRVKLDEHISGTNERLLAVHLREDVL